MDKKIVTSPLNVSEILCFSFPLSLATIPLTKTTAAQTELALSYYRVCGLYFLTVVFVATIYITY